MTADDPALPCHPDNTSPDGEYLYSGDTSPHPQICIPPPVCVETPTPSHQEAMWHQISLNGKPPAGGISGETLTHRIYEGEIFRAGLKFWRLVSSISIFESPPLDERKQGVDYIMKEWEVKICVRSGLIVGSCGECLWARGGRALCRLQTCSSSFFLATWSSTFFSGNLPFFFFSGNLVFYFFSGNLVFSFFWQLVLLLFSGNLV